MIRKSIIVAVSENGVIGANGKIPWRLPEDLRRFKALTMGHCLIMGRKAHVSIGEPLPGRTSIVLTRGGDEPVPYASHVHVATSLDEAISLAEYEECSEDREWKPEVFVCGGGEVYREALPLCDRVYLTVIERVFEGDAYFRPGVAARREWKRIEVTYVEGATLPHRFEIWERAK